MNTNQQSINAILSGCFTKNDINELSHCSIENIEVAIPSTRKTALHLFWQVTANLASEHLGRPVHIEDVIKKARGITPFGAAAHFVNDQSNH